MELVVIAVEDRGDPADVLSVAAGDEKLHLTVAEERILVAKDLGEVVAQRRDPVRVGGVEAVGDVEEAGQSGLVAADPLDDDPSAHAPTALRTRL